MVRAAARTVGNLVYLQLTANSKFTEGKALFHADHKNLIARGWIQTDSIKPVRSCACNRMRMETLTT